MVSESQRQASRRWRDKPENRLKIRAYRQTPAAKSLLRKSYAKYRASEKGRYTQAIRDARKREIPFSLTQDEYTELLRSNCTYCTYSLSPGGVGLDRLDNSAGYTTDNVVPACGECNVARYDHFSPAEALVLGRAVGEIKTQRSVVNLLALDRAAHAWLTEN